MRRAINTASFGTGLSFTNMAIGLPLLVLARGHTTLLAGSLLAVNTLSIALGALLALGLRRSERGVGYGLCLIAAGALLMSAPSTALLAVGALTHGAGNGLVWVGILSALGHRAGERGAERSFVGQYSRYVSGNISGAILTGLGIAMLRATGLEKTTSIALMFLLGACGALLALPPVVSWLREAAPSAPARPRLRLLAGLSLQAPDLFLVGAMGMAITLVPVILTQEFGVRPLYIGLVGAATALAKIAGSFAAGRIAGAAGAHVAVGSMLAISAASAAILIGVSQAWLYVAVTLTMTFFGVGAWPIMVSGALALVQPQDRASVTIAWNVREYTTIALATTTGGYLLGALAGPAVLLGLAAALLGCSSLSAFAVLRVPATKSVDATGRRSWPGVA